MSITCEDRARYRILFESLLTIDLSEEDVSWVCSCVNESHIDDSQLCLISTLSFRPCSTGRFALCFQETLHRIIEHKSLPSMLDILRCRKEYLFPELFDNDLLDDDEFSTIEDVFNLEWNAMKTSLQRMKREICSLNGRGGRKQIYNDSLRSVSVYRNSECNYLDLCQARLPSDEVYISQKTSDESYYVYSFPVLDIVCDLCLSHPGHSRIPLDDGSYVTHENELLLREKYEKEIKMYQRYVAEYLD